MEKILFASDLDNTLLFSHRNRRDTDRCVERLEGKEQGFCTPRTLELLPAVREKTLFIPVTTRSAAQYRRIQWPENCAPRYAVAANGGVLLDGEGVDPLWQARTEALAAPWRGELEELRVRVEGIPIPKRCRMVDEVYLFAACGSGEEAEALAAPFLGKTALDVAVSGRKVYFFPPPINKGAALERLRERFLPERTVCAGDSVIDLPMLRAADLAVVPYGGLLPEAEGEVRRPAGEGARFSDFVLEIVLGELRSEQEK